VCVGGCRCRSRSADFWLIGSRRADHGGPPAPSPKMIDVTRSSGRACDSSAQRRPRGRVGPIRRESAPPHAPPDALWVGNWRDAPKRTSQLLVRMNRTCVPLCYTCVKRIASASALHPGDEVALRRTKEGFGMDVHHGWRRSMDPSPVHVRARREAAWANRFGSMGASLS
jgi:hypothetical protein